jgi:hypothetical protein
VVITCFPPAGLGLGLTAWILGQSDLRKIRAGHMDRDGHGMTHGGLICGIIGTCLNGLLILSCLGFFVIGLAATPANKPRLLPPPPPPFPGPPWKDKQ